MQQYKPELDGLRAIAVISVLLFHGGFEAFQGGFVGVDVFFVLSGYLITSILLKETQAKTFTFASFYERRIRRLVPPLIPVLVFTGFSSGLLLGTQQFESMIKSTLSALGMVSNWYFLSDVGYFDGPGETTPLLHTWSLSIEEQFYLVFPAMVLLTIRWVPKYIVPACLSLLAASLLLSAWLIYSGQLDAAFYASPGRFWELLVGSLLASLGWGNNCSKNNANMLEITGAGLIALAVFSYSPATLFPGPAALLPTLGTAMIIAAAGRGTLISPLLKSKPAVWVGLISYALYLWHWPLLVLLRIIDPAPTDLLVTAALFISVCMAALSRKFIELPARSKQVLKSQRMVFGFGAVFAISVLAVSLALLTPVAERKRSGLASLISSFVYGDRSDSLSRIEAEKNFYMTQLDKNFTGKSSLDELYEESLTCSFDEGNTSSRILECFEVQAKGDVVLVIGDSVGRDTWHSLRRAYPEIRFVMLHQSSCPPGEGFHPDIVGRRCFPELAKILKIISERLDVAAVIMSYNFRPIDWRNIEPTFGLLKDITTNVAVLGVPPVYAQTIGDSIKALAAQAPIPRRVSKTDRTMVPWDFDVLAENVETMAQAHGAVFIDVRPFFCDSNSCALWLDESLKQPLFWDKLHLSEPAIEKYAIYLSELSQVQSFLYEAKLATNR